jgi:hypothetical protein
MQNKMIWFAVGFAAAFALARIESTKGFITGGNKFFG